MESKTALSRIPLSKRTFHNDENVLYLCCPTQQPLATCSYWALEMWPLVQVKMNKFILINLNVNINSCIWLEDNILDSTSLQDSLCQVAPGRAQEMADLVPPGKAHSHCTWWTASDHTGLQPYHFHKRHTEGADLVSTKTPLKQVLQVRVNSCTAVPQAVV